MPFQPASPSKPAIGAQRVTAKKLSVPIPMPISTGDPLKDISKRLERLEGQMAKLEGLIVDQIGDLHDWILTEFHHLYSQMRM